MSEDDALKVMQSTVDLLIGNPDKVTEEAMSTLALALAATLPTMAEAMDKAADAHERSAKAHEGIASAQRAAVRATYQVNGIVVDRALF